MNTTNGAGPTSLLDRLTNGIASVKTIPRIVTNADMLGRNEKVLAVCDDYLKRVRAFHGMLIAEIEPQANEARQIEKNLTGALESVQRVVDAGTLYTNLAALATPERLAQAERFKELKAKLMPHKAFMDWVGEYFWVEARNRFPALEGHGTMALRADWSIVATDGDEDHDLSDLSAMLGNALRRRRPERAHA